ncbi:hypothetical protein D9M71_534460 [compost metagenome]
MLQVQFDHLPAGFTTGFEQQAPVRVDHRAAAGEYQAVIAWADAVDHQREGLVFLGAGHDRGAMHRAVGVHVAVGYHDQVDAQLRQGAAAFWQLDVVADQQADAQAFPAHRGVAIARLEQAAFRGPEVGLAVAQGDAFRGDQQGGVVEGAGVVLRHAHHHRHVALAGGALHRLHAGPLQRLGDGGDVFGGGKAGQLGFREDHQVGVRRTGGDGRQGAFEVVGGIAVTAGELDEFDLHGGSWFLSADGQASQCSALALACPEYGARRGLG